MLTMIKTDRRTYAAEADAGAAPADAPAAVEPAATEQPAPAGDSPTLLGGEPSSTATDPSPEAVEEGEGSEPKEDAAPAEAAAELDITQLKAPEGIPGLDADALGLAEPVLRELGLGTEQAQKVVDLATEMLPGLVEKHIAARDEATAAAMAAEHQGWIKACREDAEFGGTEDNLMRNAAMARRVIDKFGDADAKEVLEGSKLGDHPALFKMMCRIANQFGEDAFHVSDASAQEARPLKAALYGEEFQKKAG
jgi:hypothetical protein